MENINLNKYEIKFLLQTNFCLTISKNTNICTVLICPIKTSSNLQKQKLISWISVFLENYIQYTLQLYSKVFLTLKIKKYMSCIENIFTMRTIVFLWQIKFYDKTFPSTDGFFPTDTFPHHPQRVSASELKYSKLYTGIHFMHFSVPVSFESIFNKSVFLCHAIIQYVM